MSIIQYNRAAGVPSEARWCFSQPLTGTIGLIGGTGNGHTFGRVTPSPGVPAANNPNVNGANSSLLSLTGYASQQSISPDIAFVDPNSINCVVGEFGTFTGFPTQVRAFTVGSAAHVGAALPGGTSAVQAAGVVGNYNDSQPVAPSDATGPLGRTTGPNILATTVDLGNNQIDYFLDHDLASANPTPVAGNFFFIDTGGTSHAGGSVAGISNNEIIVNFPGLLAGSQIAEIGLLKGAVGAADGAFDGPTPITTAGEGNQVQTTPGPAGATNSNPDLINAADVTVGGSATDQIDFTFDKQVNVASAVPALFHLYSVNDKTIINGTSVSQPNNINVIRVTFAPVGAQVDIANYLDQFVRAGADPGAVLGLAPAVANVLGTAPLNPSLDAPGFTSAPDVTRMARTANNPSVLVTFDQPVNTVGGAADYHLIGPSGNELGAAQSVSPVGLTQAFVTFSNTGNVSAAIGIQIQSPGGVFPNPPQISNIFGLASSTTTPGTFNDTAVIQTVAFATGTASQRISVRGMHMKAASKHHAKKTHKKHAKKH